MNIPRAYTPLIFAAFIAVAVLGLYTPLLGAIGQDMDCPFSVGGSALCNAPLAHIEHWQGLFTAIIIELTAAFGIVLLASRAIQPLPHVTQERQHYRVREFQPDALPLFRRLFSRGILNRKAP